MRDGRVPHDFDFEPAPYSANRNITAREVVTEASLPTGARCRIETDPSTDAALSDDGTQVAAMIGGHPTIVDTRTCRAIRTYSYRYTTTYAYSYRGMDPNAVRDPQVRAIAFAGNTHDVLVLRDFDIERLRPDGTVIAQTFGYNVTRWAVSPNGERVVLAFDGNRYERTRAALAVFDGKLAEIQRVRLDEGEAVDGLAFSARSNRLVATQPVLHDRDGRVITHVATEIDTDTWRLGHHQRIGWGEPQRTLIVADRGETLVWGSLRFDRTGALTHLEDFAWSSSAGGSVAVASDDKGYFVWNVEGARNVRRLTTHARNEYPAGMELADTWRATPSRNRGDLALQIPMGVAVDGTVLFCGGSTCDVL